MHSPTKTPPQQNNKPQLAALRMTALAWALASASGKAKEPLGRWLAAVRSAAFDERYLQRMDIEPFAG